MLMHPKKRIEVIIEAPLVERLLAVVDAQQVSGYTVLPALGGRGRGGRWRRDGLVGEAGRMVCVVCVVDPGRAEAVVAAAYELLQRQIGIVTVTDVQVLRDDHF